MRRAERWFVTGVLLVGLGAGVSTTARAEEASTDSVEQMNLDGALTSSQAEQVAQHPRVDEFLDKHPRLAEELANHPNAARFLANHPGAARFFASHPGVRDHVRAAAERWNAATPEQRAQWAANHPKAVEVHQNLKELHRDQAEKPSDIQGLQQDQWDKRQDVHDLNQDRRDRNGDLRDLGRDAGVPPPPSGAGLEQRGEHLEGYGEQMQRRGGSSPGAGRFGGGGTRRGR